MTELKGITWDHKRGYDPLIYTTKEFCRICPEVSITWNRRTLKEFGDFPVAELAKRYDLLLIDHPFIGEAYEKNLFVDLQAVIEKEHLATCQQQAIGGSFGSYCYKNKILALPVDVAGIVSAARTDILSSLGLSAPKTIEEVFLLKEKLPKGKKILVGLCPTDIWCVFLTLCAAYGGRDFVDRKRGIDVNLATDQIRMIKKLAQLSDEDPFQFNPIGILDKMAAGSEYVYSPYLFGYVNYSVRGEYEHVVTFLRAPLNGGSVAGLQGGVGIAISSSSTKIAEAAKYVKYVTAPSVQANSYFLSGGQPAQLDAWMSGANNSICNDFFFNTLPDMNAAYIRPRFPGWNDFQEAASSMLCEAVSKNEDSLGIANKLNEIFMISFKGRIDRHGLQIPKE